MTDPMTLDPFNEPLIPTAVLNPILAQLPIADAAWAAAAAAAPGVLQSITNPAIKPYAEAAAATIAPTRAFSTAATAAFKAVQAANKK